jgi:hypothetical protein
MVSPIGERILPVKLAIKSFSTVTSLLNITAGVNVIADEFAESMRLVNILPVIDVALIVPETASTNSVLSSVSSPDRKRRPQYDIQWYYL